MIMLLGFLLASWMTNYSHRDKLSIVHWCNVYTPSGGDGEYFVLHHETYTVEGNLQEVAFVLVKAITSFYSQLYVSSVTAEDECLIIQMHDLYQEGTAFLNLFQQRVLLACFKETFVSVDGIEKMMILPRYGTQEAAQARWGFFFIGSPISLGDIDDDLMTKDYENDFFNSNGRTFSTYITVL